MVLVLVRCQRGGQGELSTFVQPGLQEGRVELVESIKDDEVSVKNCSNQVTSGEIDVRGRRSLVIFAGVEVFGVGKGRSGGSLLSVVLKLGVSQLGYVVRGFLVLGSVFLRFLGFLDNLPPLPV